MKNGNVADKKPVIIDLPAGTHYWCSCGNSKNQPFCDGSHKGTEFKSLKFILVESKKVALCNCKQTKNGPFCDGSHSAL